VVSIHTCVLMFSKSFYPRLFNRRIDRLLSGEFIARPGGNRDEAQYGFRAVCTLAAESCLQPVFAGNRYHENRKDTCKSIINSK